MLNPTATARAYETGYALKSKRIYARLEQKSDEELRRYNAVLQPKGFINSFLALFDADRQLKISCLEDILELREQTKNKNQNKAENKNPTPSTYKGVHLMTSDQDMKLVNEPVYKNNHPLNTLLNSMLSKGYRK